jgi:hypothetical protein
MDITDQGLEDRDRGEVERLLAHYGHVADDPSLEGIRLIFSEDGVFDAPRTTPPTSSSGATTARSALSKYLAPGGMMSGDYRDVLVRTGDGWRIAERIAIARHPQRQSVAAGFPDAAASEGGR